MITPERPLLIHLFPIVVVLICAVTAIPLSLRAPSLRLVYTKWNWIDIGINVLLYLPLGVVSGTGPLRSAAIGAVLSLFAESVQLFSAGRFPGVFDVVSNTAGAVLGSLVAARLQQFGVDPTNIRISRATARIAVLVAGVCLISLVPLPVGARLSNWDPSFHMAFGDELNGSRRWRGEILSAAVVPDVVDAAEIDALTRAGPSALRMSSVDLPSATTFLLAGPISTGAAPVVVPDAVAAPLFDAIIKRNRLSVLLWIRSGDQRQQGPARIFTWSADAYRRNFTIGQEHRDVVFRLRTTATGLNGTSPAAETPPIISTGRLTFIAAAFDGRYSRIYVDGRLVTDLDLTGQRVFGGIPSLGFAACAGVFLYIGAYALWPWETLRRMGAAIACTLGVFVISVVPRADAPHLTAPLLVTFGLGAIAGHRAMKYTIWGRRRLAPSQR